MSTPSRPADTRLVLGLYQRMCLLRAFDAAAGAAYARKEIHGTHRGSKGQEAIPVGVCAALHERDVVFPSLRAVGDSLARGTDPALLMAELFGKATGVAGGRGGSLHVADASHNVMGASGVLGANAPLAAGAALAAQIRADGALSVCFFGDRATNEGAFHESLNVAALLKLPVLFVAINNAPEDADTALAEHTAAESMAALAAAHCIPAEIVDGTNVLTVYAHAAAAVEAIRAGSGPRFLECRSFPLDEPSRSQIEAWKAEMRATGEFAGMLMVKKSKVGTAALAPPAHWLAADPLVVLEQHILTQSLATRSDLTTIQSAAQTQIETALTFARSSPTPDPATAFAGVFAEAAALRGGTPSPGG